MLRYRRLRSRDPRKGPAKVPSPLHPDKRYPVTQKEWEKVKDAVFARSAGKCEAVERGKRCLGRIFRSTFEPHHIKHRVHGGSDQAENILACCAACHERLDGRRLEWRRA
jgi:hypothetical protein